MMQKHLTDKVAGGGRRFLAEKLPDNFGVFETPDGFTYMLSGALEVHRLAVQDKLKGREEELTEEIINATCTIDEFYGCYKEVSESPRSLSSLLPDHATVPRKAQADKAALLLLSKVADPKCAVQSAF